MVAAAQHHGGSAGTTELSGWRRLLSLRRRPCNSSPQISPPTVRPWTLPPALATTASASKSLMAWLIYKDFSSILYDLLKLQVEAGEDRPALVLLP
ncbi:hypothetical protein BS78_K182700 [Paspalum vaginatum]|uniref:Uncharacterized protein n=1 Tax=Paspalum vaginatum TaxID=158149 RepID=A0A9W7X7K8_9POAL|nr:hypothetical protein BS78_K182700 [Paspalum vaginatum]